MTQTKIKAVLCFSKIIIEQTEGQKTTAETTFSWLEK